MDRVAKQQYAEASGKILDGCRSNVEWYASYMLGNEPRIKADADFIARHVPKHSNILDVGGVPPLFLEYLSAHGFHSLALVDPHPEPFTPYLDSSNIRYYKANLLNCSLPELDGKFDLVCLNEVLEHISGNLLTAISNAVDCVRAGGMVMVTTPNLRSVWGLYSLLVKCTGLASKPNDTVRAQYDRASATDGYYGHIREYTQKEVVELLGSFGLTLVQCEFQKDYRSHGMLSKPLGIMEELFPNWRLFGKYLFQKSCFSGSAT